MTALIVDDQINIISGLVSGVGWHEIGITKLYTACSALEARQIIMAGPVDILLCDIEMPDENGISLLSWIRQNHYNIECIFLTAHADFMYAKEAIQLNCYDYILQPARYRDVQESIHRVMERIRQKQEEESYIHLGKRIVQEKDHIMQEILRSWITGEPTAFSDVRQQFENVGISLKGDWQAHYLLVQIHTWRPEPWAIGRLTFSIHNILQEILQSYQVSILCSALDSASIGIIIHKNGSALPREDSLFPDIQNLYQLCSSWFQCECAIYWYSDFILSDAVRVFQQTMDLKLNNINQVTGIFPFRQTQVSSIPAHIDISSLQLWEQLLNSGNIVKLETVMYQYLQHLAASRQLNRKSLQNFWAGFLQILFSVLQQQELTLRDMVPVQADRDTVLDAPENLEDAVRRIKMVLAAYPVQEFASENSAGIVSRVKDYISGHLDQPLPCSSVADSLYLNQSYLSRLFKQQTGMSLKEYITKKKMEKAQILIQTTALPISIIAAKVGYDNFSHFSQVYKKVYGITATDARK